MFSKSLKVQKVRKYYSYRILPCVFASLRLCVFSKIEKGETAKTHMSYIQNSKSSSVITVNPYFMEEVASLHLLSFHFSEKTQRRKDAKTQRRYGRIPMVKCILPYVLYTYTYGNPVNQSYTLWCIYTGILSNQSLCLCEYHTKTQRHTHMASRQSLSLSLRSK